ncbi:DUF4331 family protein [Nocardioides sp. CN2-186]|uniref:DUF4331 family protein n=1 Tax=Nocardioides tweenelious TaxID=3156607 RepID=UPI0032B60D46
MSNHFTGLSLGPPLGDQRLDLCDLYAFQAPGDPTRTVLILNANPNADALHPDAIYRLAIDNDGDYLDDIAISWVFAPPTDAGQAFDVYVATGADARSAEAVGTRVVEGGQVSFGADAHVVHAGDHTFFAGARSDAFFFDFDGIKNLFDIRGHRNFTAPHFGSPSPWTGVDSNLRANVFSMVVELPTEVLGADPDLHIWGRCSVRQDGRLVHVDRAGHPSVSSFFNTDETKEEYNASEPVHDVGRWTDQFVHLMGHTGGYTREEAVAAIEVEGLLPDVLTFEPTRPARYPNGRVFTDDVINHRLLFLSKGDVPPPGLAPHSDTLAQFPYLGSPHPPA